MFATLQRAWIYAAARPDELLAALLQHLRYVGVALGVSMAVCIPLGVWTSRTRLRPLALSIINIFNSLRIIPSLAILFLALPYFGLTFTSSAIALIILALPPV
ncbi:MAG: ABC transporter permease, partial [Anaerolineae bacterium]|nr:ABC transporter permease [Anaerolineae bacterium]